MPLIPKLRTRLARWCAQFRSRSSSIDLDAFAAKDRAIARALKAELPGWSIVYFDEAAAARADYQGATASKSRCHERAAATRRPGQRTCRHLYIGRRCVFSALVDRVNDWGLGARQLFLYNDAVCEARIMLWGTSERECGKRLQAVGHLPLAIMGVRMRVRRQILSGVLKAATGIA